MSTYTCAEGGVTGSNEEMHQKMQRVACQREGLRGEECGGW